MSSETNKIYYNFGEKTISEIHLGLVGLLKVRGEEVVQPRGKPMGSIDGYDKTIGLISAGSIVPGRDQSHLMLGDGTYDLLQDIAQPQSIQHKLDSHIKLITHAYTGVKLDNLGLCDARCWYEAIDDKRIQDANKEQAEKLAFSQFGNTNAKAKLGAALAELCINVGEGQAVISPDGKIDFNDTGLNISLRDLKFVVQEAEAYMTYTKYRKER